MVYNHKTIQFSFVLLLFSPFGFAIIVSQMNNELHFNGLNSSHFSETNEVSPTGAPLLSLVPAAHRAVSSLTLRHRPEREHGGEHTKQLSQHASVHGSKQPERSRRGH